VVADGAFEGIPLPQLVYAHPELLGEGVEPALLIKILDSAQRLSVQVHPDDRLAREMGLDSGKTECWYYLESEPGALIYCGLKEGVETAPFFEKARQNPGPEEMAALMNAVEVKEGELSFISAGTLHAIGKGVLLMEVQQNSDTTFRIYDWGRPREVHLDDALRAMVETQPEEAEVHPSAERGTLVKCGKFIMSRIPCRGREAFPPTGPVYGALTCLDGQGAIRCEGYTSGYRGGDTYFLPAGCPALELEGDSIWIHSTQND
jgi:mannose-6-phosphate isomerase